MVNKTEITAVESASSPIETLCVEIRSLVSAKMKKPDTEAVILRKSSVLAAVADTETVILRKSAVLAAVADTEAAILGESAVLAAGCGPVTV